MFNSAKLYQKKKLEKPKPAPKYKQQNMFDFLKEIWEMQIDNISKFLMENAFKYIFQRCILS